MLYRKEVQTFSFRNEEDYYAGKSVILVQMRLDDTIYIQTRNYTKIHEIFSRIGGYMQLMNTIFLLVSSLVNKLNSEIKIINSIFDFSVKENKMILNLRSLKETNFIINLRNKKNMSFKLKKPIVDEKQLECQNKSKSKIDLIESNFYNESALNISNNKKNSENNNLVLKINENKKFLMKQQNENNKNGDSNIQINKDKFQKNFYDVNNRDNDTEDYNDRINLNIFEYLCFRNWEKSKKYKFIELFKKGNLFYRNKMNITHVFTLLAIIEDALIIKLFSSI